MLLHQSIQAPLTSRDTATLSGSVQTSAVVALELAMSTAVWGGSPQSLAVLVVAAAKNTRDTDFGDVLKLCLTQILSPTQSGTPAKNTDRRDLDFLTFAFPTDA